MTHYMIGDKMNFAIEYAFNDDSENTEIALYVHGMNILEFLSREDGKLHTTCWGLHDLAEWLRRFIDNMAEDPYPVNAEGRYAAEKDDNARNFDSDDENVFDAYYDRLDRWNTRHRWHSESDGAILADVFFQQVGEMVEISWDNRGIDEEVCQFVHLTGGDSVPKSEFVDVVNGFLKAYAEHWFPVE